MNTDFKHLSIEAMKHRMVHTEYNDRSFISGMIGYGMAKAAIHQLVKSLADSDKSGLPEGTFTAAILPITLDTPMNRKWMPKAGSKSNQFETWRIKVTKGI